MKQESGGDPEKPKIGGFQGDIIVIAIMGLAILLKFASHPWLETLPIERIAIICIGLLLLLTVQIVALSRKGKNSPPA
jgi:hypothetical protein